MLLDWTPRATRSARYTSTSHIRHTVTHPASPHLSALVASRVLLVPFLPILTDIPSPSVLFLPPSVYRLTSAFFPAHSSLGATARPCRTGVCSLGSAILCLGLAARPPHASHVVVNGICPQLVKSGCTPLDGPGGTSCGRVMLPERPWAARSLRALRITVTMGVSSVVLTCTFGHCLRERHKASKLPFDSSAGSRSWILYLSRATNEGSVSFTVRGRFCTILHTCTSTNIVPRWNG